MNRRALFIALAGTVACGGPQESARKPVSAIDTIAAFGHTQVDTTGRAKTPTITQAQIDSQNAAIRERMRGTKLAPSPRVVRRIP